MECLLLATATEICWRLLGTNSREEPLFCILKVLLLLCAFCSSSGWTNSFFIPPSHAFSFSVQINNPPFDTYVRKSCDFRAHYTVFETVSEDGKIWQMKLLHLIVQSLKRECVNIYSVLCGRVGTNAPTEECNWKCVHGGLLGEKLAWHEVSRLMLPISNENTFGRINYLSMKDAWVCCRVWFEWSLMVLKMSNDWTICLFLGYCICRKKK